MLCAKCNKDNPADASFCEECGAKLELILSGPYAHGGLRVPDEAVTEIVDVADLAAAAGVAFDMTLE